MRDDTMTADRLLKIMIKRGMFYSEKKLRETYSDKFEFFHTSDISNLDRRKKINELKRQGFTHFVPKMGKVDYTLTAFKNRSQTIKS